MRPNNASLNEETPAAFATEVPQCGTALKGQTKRAESIRTFESLVGPRWVAMTYIKKAIDSGDVLHKPRKQIAEIVCKHNADIRLCIGPTGSIGLTETQLGRWSHKTERPPRAGRVKSWGLRLSGASFAWLKRAWRRGWWRR
jgi:hypothetical protein